MSEIILGYGVELIWRGGYFFEVYEGGEVNYGKFIYTDAPIYRQVVETKKFFVPKSAVENVKNCLLDKKILIDKFPEETIQLGLVIDGSCQYFNFLGKAVHWWNISRITEKGIKELEKFVGKLSADTKNLIQQQHKILDIFEEAYKFLKDYGLKIYYEDTYYGYDFVCDWKF